MRARAVLFKGVNAVALDGVEVPAPGPGEVLIDAEFTAVSPGTELRSLAGLQAGFDGWPFIPGYSLAGRVAECGEGTTLRPGDRVVCSGTARASVGRLWGGHVSRAVRAESAVHRVPPTVSLLEASLAPLAAIALRGVRLANPRLGDSVAVLGLGMIGQFSARLHAAAGARVLGVDRVASRVDALRHASIAAALAEPTASGAVRHAFPEGADLVVDCTGDPKAMGEAVAAARDLPWEGAARPPARVVVQGSYAGDFAVPYQEAFQKELALLIPRARQPEDLDLVLSLLADGRLPVQGLAEVRDPAGATRAYADLRSGVALGIVFHWRGNE